MRITRTYPKAVFYCLTGNAVTSADWTSFVAIPDSAVSANAWGDSWGNNWGVSWG